MKEDQLISERGKIVDKFLNIEWTVSLIISQKYLGKQDMAFIQEVMCDDAVTFGLRMNILEKIAPKKPFYQDLRRLNKIRNYFAHCPQMVLDIDEETQTGKRVSVHPKKPELSVEFEELSKEFDLKYQAVRNELYDLLMKSGAKQVEPKDIVPILD